MAGEISLVFLGGIADTGKSALTRVIEQRIAGVVPIKISEYFKLALQEKLTMTIDGPLAAAMVYSVDWKSVESRAVEMLIKDIREDFRAKRHCKTLLINTHFATYSPGGYMMGLDPQSLLALCDACNLCEDESVQKAFIVLVDIGITDVLQRREKQWMKMFDGTSATQDQESKAKKHEMFSTSLGLTQDLEFNRLYALEYFNTLSTVLPKRVKYHRIFVDWELIEDYKNPFSKAPAFENACNRLVNYLNSELPSN